MNKQRLKEWWALIVKYEKRLIVKVAVAAHLSYYALVALEAHGNYRWAAAGVFIALVLGEHE